MNGTGHGAFLSKKQGPRPVSYLLVVQLVGLWHFPQIVGRTLWAPPVHPFKPTQIRRAAHYPTRDQATSSPLLRFRLHSSTAIPVSLAAFAKTLRPSPLPSEAWPRRIPVQAGLLGARGICASPTGM
jgi:hypothetical protein